MTNFEKDTFRKESLTYKQNFKPSVSVIFHLGESMKSTSQELIVVSYFQKNVKKLLSNFEYSKSQKAMKF